MALKLGKCRLCLKLGDFYSIFTVDNSLQLAEMVMECTKVKVREGDGLPDKVCSECIQKLSGAYIFKQQCERSDQELRRNYVPPPGFRSTPPPTRQSSDSAFSNHTDLSTPRPLDGRGAGARRRRSRDSDASAPPAKQPRAAPPPAPDSDPDDRGYSHYSDDDSDEPVLPRAPAPAPAAAAASPLAPGAFPCDLCDKVYPDKRRMMLHRSWHSRWQDSNAAPPAPTPAPPALAPAHNSHDSHDDDDKLSCDKCGKTFKLKIMLRRHHDVCAKPSPTKSPQKQLLVSLEPIAAGDDRRLACSICPTRFKTHDNLDKHMRVCHAARAPPRGPRGPAPVPVPCLFCGRQFEEHMAHVAHFHQCPSREELATFECPLCRRVMYKRNAYLQHVRTEHFAAAGAGSGAGAAGGAGLQCRMCGKALPTQEQLIKHLAEHVSGVEDASSQGDGSSTAEEPPPLQSGSSPVPLRCRYCDKTFTYRKPLLSHERKHETGELEIKSEPPDPGDPGDPTDPADPADPADPDGLGDVTSTMDASDSDSSDDGDNTCDICEKMFSYKRLLIQHKKTKHNMSSGTKRSKIMLKDCFVKCLICDVTTQVLQHKAHNQQHLAANIKPRNLYTCAGCGDASRSLQALGAHIKLVHRLGRARAAPHPVPDLADFCEVVVTKTEPLDTVQSHNGDEVPSGRPPQPGSASAKPLSKQDAALVDLSGFTCPVCAKKMDTLVSLKRHVNWHTNVGNHLEKKIECFVCKEMFRFKGHYRLHMRAHYRDTQLDPRFLVCELCGRKSKHLRAAIAHNNFHKQTRFQGRDYRCSICKRLFQKRHVYLSHMAIHYKRGETSQNIVVGDAAPADRKPDAAHTCSLCGKVCDNENNLKHHLIWHRSKTLLFGARHECPVCQLTFTNKRVQQLHLRAHYEDADGPFACPTCGKRYSDEDYFRRHVKGHNFDHQSHKKRIAKLRENKVKCPICDKYYPELVKLIRHLRRSHPHSKMIKTDPDEPARQVYSCKLCAKVFFEEKRLLSHEEAHLRKPEFFKCKFCGKKTISLKNHNIHIKGHLTTKHVDNPLRCPQCPEHFVRGYDLHWHLRDAHGITETWIADRNQQALAGPLKELQCSVCLKVLASKGNFERHIDYHNSLRCNYCHDYFSSLRFLEGHLKHACEKNRLLGDTEPHARRIKCDRCYKAFHVQVKLDCHLRTQHAVRVAREVREGKKEIVCDYCFRVFENEHALAGHKVYHRTVGYFGCIYCERKFNTLTVYRKHKNHHFAQINADSPYKCEHCDETFVPFREMIYHMRDAHADDKEWIVYPKEPVEETCPICSKVFFNLPRHLQYHEENRCKKCLEYFYSRVDFDEHLCAIESDDEPEAGPAAAPAYSECRFCFKPITKTNSKLKHDLLHKASGSISCRFCALKFKTIDAFNIHAFSHRSRKYNKRPLKCRECGERFVRYGPFIKHMKGVHKSKLKMHYRGVVREERCVVCGEDFPNLHNHYRAHLQNRCPLCAKYFSSSRLFQLHECAKEDADPTKVFVSDEDLPQLINAHVPRDLSDEEKYCMTEDEEPPEEAPEEAPPEPPEPPEPPADDDRELLVPLSVQSPIISDVLSLYRRGQADDVIDLSDDSVGFQEPPTETVTIDD